MNVVIKESNYYISLFKPKINKLFYGSLRIINLHETIRLLLAMIHGYRIYYMFDNYNNEIGYCMVSRGGSFRYPFTNSKDIIVGPYFIKQEYRGNGFSRILVNHCIKDLETDYINAYDFIQNSNFVSIRTTLSCGFVFLSYGYFTRYLRRLETTNNNTEKYKIFVYRNIDSERRSKYESD